jgi:hypothetical protein
MATALNGRARRIPLVQRLSFATRSASGWIRRRPDEQGDLCNEQTMSDRLVAATEDAERHRPSLITNHQSPLTGLNRWRGFESPQVKARVPPPEFEHAVIPVCLPAKSAPFADQ